MFLNLVFRFFSFKELLCLLLGFLQMNYKPSIVLLLVAQLPASLYRAGVRRPFTRCPSLVGWYNLFCSKLNVRLA